MNWTHVNEAMPQSGEVVLASYVNEYGQRQYVVGHYLARFTHLSDYEDDYHEYSEELDNYFLCEGWYEQQLNWDDYGYICIREGTVDYWAPLPAVPVAKP